jgi:hypothetical protein
MTFPYVYNSCNNAVDRGLIDRYVGVFRCLCKATVPLTENCDFNRLLRALNWSNPEDFLAFV